MTTEYLVLRARGKELCTLSIEREPKTPYLRCWRTSAPQLVINHVWRRYRTSHVSAQLFGVTAEEMEHFLDTDALCTKHTRRPFSWWWAGTYVLGGAALGLLFLTKLVAIGAFTLLMTVIVLGILKKR